MKGTGIYMSEEFKEYRRRTPRQRKTSEKHKKESKRSILLKILLRQTVFSVAVFVLMFGIKTIDPHKSNKISTYIRNAFTQPVNTENMPPVLKNIFKSTKNVFTKEGLKNEPPDDTPGNTH